MKFHPQHIKDIKELIIKCGSKIKYKVTNDRQYFILDKESYDSEKIIRNFFPGSKIINVNKKNNKISFRLNPEY